MENYETLISDLVEIIEKNDYELSCENYLEDLVKETLETDEGKFSIIEMLVKIIQEKEC